MTLDEILVQQLTRDEGERAFPYLDTGGAVTIGIGRNLSNTGLRPEEIQFLFENDRKAALADVQRFFPWSEQLDIPRLAALVNLVFNMGIHRVLQFRKMLSALQASDWSTAAKELLDSTASHQEPNRIQRLAKQLEDGVVV